MSISKAVKLSTIDLFPSRGGVRVQNRDGTMENIVSERLHSALKAYAIKNCITLSEALTELRNEIQEQH